LTLSHLPEQQDSILVSYIRFPNVFANLESCATTGSRSNVTKNAYGRIARGRLLLEAVLGRLMDALVVV